MSEPKIYSVTRSDRSGAVIHDLLRAHAYATSLGRTYGGSIGYNKYLQKSGLLEALGLDIVLKQHARLPQGGEEIGQKHEYRGAELNDALYTAEWVENMARKPRQVALSRFPKTAHRIVVHVRRGDVTRAVHPDRYLPNSYYLRQIDKYRGSGSEVIVFCQSPSEEPLKDFEDAGCIVHMDGPLEDVWLTAINSDVFIMSKSGFSHVPALFAAGRVVYHPYWQRAQDNWIVAEPD
jgi:hypothetical protein